MAFDSIGEMSQMSRAHIAQLACKNEKKEKEEDRSPLFHSKTDTNEEKTKQAMQSNPKNT